MEVGEKTDTTTQPKKRTSFSTEFSPPTPTAGAVSFTRHHHSTSQQKKDFERAFFAARVCSYCYSTLSPPDCATLVLSLTRGTLMDGRTDGLLCSVLCLYWDWDRNLESPREPYVFLLLFSLLLLLGRDEKKKGNHIKNY